MHIAQVGDVVRVHYSRLALMGATPRKATGRRVLEFVVGSSDLIPGLSFGVVGMVLGDCKRIALPPKEAYGDYDDSLHCEVSRERIPKHISLRLGKRLTLIGQKSRRRRRVRIVEIRPDSVVLDGNHPLAGKVVELEVRLLSLDTSSNANHSKPQVDMGGEG